MKIALLLSGQLRQIERGYEFIHKNLIEGYDVDVFIHSWYNPEEENKKFSKWWESKLSPNSDQKAILLYNPKRYLIEPQKSFDNKSYDASMFEGSYRVNATLSMFYSIQECNRLKNIYCVENNVEYDIVVRCRFDFAIFNKINYENFNTTDTIYFKDDCTHEPSVCMNDHFAFGPPNLMNIYCNTFNEIENLYYNHNTLFNPEIFLGRNLKMLNKINCVNTPIKSGIIRDDNNTFWISET